MLARRWGLALPFAALMLALAALPGWALAGAQPACTFELGFKVLRDMIPDVVGECLEDERFNLDNGNAEQRTSGGLMVWRKADNWTAFTNGATTWINGPEGLASRPNAGPLFPWEAPPQAAPAPAPGPSGPVAVPPTATPVPPTPTPVPRRDPWIGEFRFGTNESGAGAVPSGSSMRLVENTTVWGWFSWRDVPAGTVFSVRVNWGKKENRRFDYTPSQPSGTLRVGLARVPGLASGDWRFVEGDMSLAVWYGGSERGRGYILVE